MCIDGACQMIMNDATIQRMLSNPILGLVHKQVVMVLYSLKTSNRLETYKEVLPVYLAADWATCSGVLDTIEEAGLLTRTATGIELSYSLPVDDTAGSCECHR